MLDVISFYQMNTLFLLFAIDIEDSIETFLLQSNITPLAHNRYILLHAFMRVDYYFIFPFLQVLQH